MEVNPNTKRQPKGGMCYTCENINKDCSNLDFDSMVMIHRPNIVKCTEYVKRVK